jgi:hypothetical protein
MYSIGYARLLDELAPVLARHNQIGQQEAPRLMALQEDQTSSAPDACSTS